ncbi:dephospho-CoA kinase [Vagococcus sp.]|uniref:dephospho-CoA kinase n=1 Tax=Vagococcus sp. TaxID=1933889 RepID=UPI003F9B349E
MTYILGLTGGIASGKSTASHYLKQKEIPVVDADKIAREVVAIGTPGLNAIIKVFGPDILLNDQTLDRKKLGTIVFNDAKKRRLLDELLAEYIHQAILLEILNFKKQKQALIVLDIPLLYEAKYDQLVDSIMVVWVDHQTQISRLRQRDKLTLKEAEKRIMSQWPLDKKAKKADFIIDNSDATDVTFMQLDRWLKSFGEQKEKMD